LRERRAFALSVAIVLPLVGLNVFGRLVDDRARDPFILERRVSDQPGP